MIERLAELNRVGAIAERLAMEYERDRLKRAGHRVESLSVRHVGSLKMDAGYDIESFDGRSPAVHFDRFIEVKGSRGAKVRFIWSANEMRVAKELGRRYWIYFQGGIDSKEGRAKNKMLLYQDPVVSILKNAAFTATEHGVLIEGGVQGDVVAQR